MSPGPPWWAAIPRHFWPDGLAEELAACWDADHGDRRTELVLIGQELDHEAAREQLESCLLTAKEMACGEESWLALADPWKAAKQGGVDGVHYPHDEHGPLSGVTEASLREMMKRASKQASAPPLAVNTESLDHTCTRDPLPLPSLRAGHAHRLLARRRVRDVLRP